MAYTYPSQQTTIEQLPNDHLVEFSRVVNHASHPGNKHAGGGGGGAKGKPTNPKIVDRLRKNSKGPKITDQQAKKLKILNPGGITNKTFKIPKQFGSKDPDKLKKLKSTLPPGTKIVRVNAAASKRASKPGASQKKTSGRKLVSKAHSKIKKINLTNSVDGPGVIDGSVAGSKATSLGVSSKIKPSKGKINPGDSRAIFGWTGGDYIPIRNNVSAVHGDSNKKLSERSKDFLSAIEKQPKVTGSLYRGIKTEAGFATGKFVDGKYGPKMAQALAQLGVGGEFTDVSPSSFSRSPLEASSFGSFTEPSSKRSAGIMIKIKSKTARSVGDVSHSKREQEAVALPGTRYRVKKIVKNARLNLRAADGYMERSKVAIYIEMDEI